MNGEEVKSALWKNVTVLFDNDDFSVIAGNYKNEGQKIGIRWNGGNKNGFPLGCKGNPEWFVIPPELKHCILLSLIQETLISKNLTDEVRNMYIENIRNA